MCALETKRLLLRDWSLEDMEDLYEYAKNPLIGPMAGWRPHKNRGETLEVLHSFIALNEMWAIVHKENGRVIGSVGIHADTKRPQIDGAKMLGYVLAQGYWGAGLATEAARAAVAYAFNKMRVEILSAYHYPSNERSKRVIEKCGFHFEGIIRRATKRYDGKILDNACYSLLKSEYLATAAEAY